MNYDMCTIRIRPLENAWEVELPDMSAMKKAMADAKKKSNGSMPYMGDMTKKYAAKDVKEVIKLVTGALKSLPEHEYDTAFEEAASK